MEGEGRRRGGQRTTSAFLRHGEWGCTLIQDDSDGNSVPTTLAHRMAGWGVQGHYHSHSIACFVVHMACFAVHFLVRLGNLPLTFVNGDTGTFEHEGTLRAIEQKGSGIGGVHERALHASWTCYGRARQLGEGYVLPDSEVKGTYC